MTEEQQALLMKAKESLAAAKLLLSKGMNDFAVSRAYYSMFYVTKVFLLEKELTFSKHSAVISAFGKHFAATGLIPVEFHRFLIEGQDARNAGDYLTDSEFNDTETQEQISRAEKFIELGERMLGPIDEEK